MPKVTSQKLAGIKVPSMNGDVSKCDSDTRAFAVSPLHLHNLRPHARNLNWRTRNWNESLKQATPLSMRCKMTVGNHREPVGAWEPERKRLGKADLSSAKDVKAASTNYGGCAQPGSVTRVKCSAWLGDAWGYHDYLLR